MLTAHMTFCIAPVTDQSASTPPIERIVIPVPLFCVMVFRLPCRRLVACPGITWFSLPITVVIACGPATRLKTPTATINTDGIARNA